MSAAEILEELPKLTHEERLKIVERIAEMESLEELDTNPELNAAITQGLRSLDTEPVVPLKEVHDKISRWAGQSS